MANLLDRYGLKFDPNKNFSISFIDGFVDCSYRMFLSHFIGIRPPKCDIPKVFGSGVHRGLGKINELLMGNADICGKCPKSCKITTKERSKAMDVPMEECRIKQLMMEEFLLEFNEEFEEMALSTYKNKPIEEVKQELLNHRQYAYNCMCNTAFRVQPRGEVLLTEKTFTGKLGEHNIMGVIDLALGIDQGNGPKTLILDYKTAATAPDSKLPYRQLSMYVHLLESQDLPVNGVGAIYMLKKNPPKVVRKGSKPFEQSKMLFSSLDNPKERAVFDRTIKHLDEDMSQIKDSICNGIFMRNRRSMFCGVCELKDYCESNEKLDSLIASGQTKVGKN